MKYFYIIANTRKQLALTAREEICSYLEAHSCVCHVPEEKSRRQSPESGRQGGYRYTDPASIPRETECILVLGGDGTLLQASRDLVGRGWPLLGINLGTLGYLAEIGKEDAPEALDRLIADKYSLEDRMMLTGTVWRDGEKLLGDVALNDIVIGRHGPLKVVDFQIFVNEALLCTYRADGIIVSTPTGSTGYSLSAGGPIVAPEASLMLLTAIAPHTLSSRPIVLPDNVEISVEIGGRKMFGADGLPVCHAAVSFDGDTTLMLMPGDQIRIRRSNVSTRLVKIRNTSFVENMRQKMS